MRHDFTFNKLFLLFLFGPLFLISCNSGNTIQPQSNFQIQQNISKKFESQISEAYYYSPFAFGNIDSSNQSNIGTSVAVDEINSINYFIYTNTNNPTDKALRMRWVNQTGFSNGGGIIPVFGNSGEINTSKMNSGYWQIPNFTSSVVGNDGSLYVAFYSPDNGSIYINKYLGESPAVFTFKQLDTIQAPINLMSSNGYKGQFFKLYISGESIYLAYLDRSSSVAITEYDPRYNKFKPIGVSKSYPSLDGVGTEISQSASNDVDLVVADGYLVVAYQGNGVSKNLALKKYNIASDAWSDWNSLNSSKYYSTGVATHINLANGGNGNLYAAFKDSGVNNGDLVVAQTKSVTSGDFSIMENGCSEGGIIGDGIGYVSSKSVLVVSYVSAKDGNIIVKLKNTSDASPWKKVFEISNVNDTANKYFLMKTLYNGNIVMFYNNSTNGLTYASAELLDNQQKLVFTTNKTFSGDMGGFGGADADCQNSRYNYLIESGAKWHAMLWQNPNYNLNPNDTYYDVYDGNLVSNNWVAVHPNNSSKEFLNIYSGVTSTMLISNNLAENVWTGWSDYFPHQGNVATLPNGKTINLSHLGPNGNGSSWSCQDWKSNFYKENGSYGEISSDSYKAISSIDSFLVGNPQPGNYFTSWMGVASDVSDNLNPETQNCNAQLHLICVGPYWN